MDEVQGSGSRLADLLRSHLEGTEVDDLYIEEDEEGPYLGIVFTNGEKAFHLTIDGDGMVEFSEGPVENDLTGELEEVARFRIGQIQPPFSEDSTALN